VQKAPETKPSKLAAKNFSDDAAGAAVKDWHHFVLVELNGVATLLRFDADEGGKRAAEISRRARAIVDTLGWDPATACAQAWTFTESRLEEPADAWAPHLVLSTWGGDPGRVQAWLGRLPPEARAFIDSTKLS
jgi:hypothetical protein